MSNQFWLSEEQFARLQPLLPHKVRGVPRVDDRRVISGIVHVLQSGCRWRDAPPVSVSLTKRCPQSTPEGRECATSRGA